MEVTIVSHAGLLVRHDGVSVLFDPWIIGSCYWRSWWNYPEPSQPLIESLQPDFIYLTHLHWDHFHGPSLRRFSAKTRFLVPKVHTRRMVDDLHYLGFTDVAEVAHGESLALASGFRLASFQFGIGSDSAVVLNGGGTTIFNANDCKLFGRPLRRIVDRFGPIDFVLRSYSSASAIPYCIEDYERRWPDLRKPDNYVEEFAQFALHIDARYAVPFASNHCFLHRDTMRFNATSVSPERVAEHLNARAKELGRRTRAVVMPPGSSWSDSRGFQIQPFDYEKKDEYIAELADKHREKLEASYAEDAEAKPDFAHFEAYMKDALAAMPSFLPRVKDLRVTFEVEHAGGVERWFADFGKKTIARVAESDPSTLIVRMPARILNDCTEKWMFSTLGPSKRLSFRVPEDHSWLDVRIFLSLLDMYELELLPLSAHLRPRHLSIWLKRWPELVELLRLVVKHKVLRKPFRIANLYPVPG
jgi:UDP-MurNAc hydroxylase